MQFSTEPEFKYGDIVWFNPIDEGIEAIRGPFIVVGMELSPEGFEMYNLGERKEDGINLIHDHAYQLWRNRYAN